MLGGVHIPLNCNHPETKKPKREKRKYKHVPLRCTVWEMRMMKSPQVPYQLKHHWSIVDWVLGPLHVMYMHLRSIHNYVLERFPPLTLAGGYELCLFQRGGDDQGFHKLEMPYSPA